MKSVYIVMSKFYSPIMFCIPTPKAVFSSRKLALEFCNKHNSSNRTSTEYYIRKAENMQ